ncbi:hypothetical protein C8A01DRAFT_17617 [Parachaetomium inaequale]|uniref:Uncharacterized protein n=1 Tax=Parachaetomium inaequale TaxID=2588326 RepID=A0AAN6PE54_9PEZI|nr:hypothetical protein C8A01DRAFT_17617 [Parachaetomium inaequale]
MVGCANHVSGTKGETRLRPCGLKIKTTQASASNDWRKRTAAVSSPGASAKMNKKSYDPSDDICIRLDFETDDSFSGPQYRYPRDKKAAWENVVSAPVWQLPSSSSSLSGDDTREVTKIQLKQVNPILTSVNGQGIALPNRFAFDVVAVDPQNPSPGIALGELKRLNGPAAFRRVLSDDSDELLVELQDMLGANHDVPSSATSASSEFQDYPQEARPQQKQDGSDSVVSGFLLPETGPSRARTGPPSEEEARFQRMLNRLQNNHPAPPTHQANGAATSSRRILDPAIVAMKVKDKVEALERNTQGPDREAANTFFARQLDHMRQAGPHNSTDSGYGSNNRAHNPSDPSGADLRNEASHTPKELSLDDAQTKTLNPAAAEFRSAAPNDATPWLSPKKLSRPPLTNIFPDAMPSHPALPHTSAAESIPSQGPQQAGVPATAGNPHGERVINNGAPAQATLPTPQPVLRPPEFAGSISGIVPNGFPSANTLPRPMMPPMGLAATMSAATLAGSPLLATLGGLPSAAALNASMGLPPMGLPTANAFNTFPPAAGAPMQIFAQTAAAGVNQCLPLTGSFIPVPPPQSSMGPDGKPNRPYFPVTTKPRDHDPVKQQMYEAYLEWRKANEPGYHMKCKMRQANRVMRQCQQQQEKKTLVSNPANWKAIAEKAKAAVGAAAAAAAAEKKLLQESVREELREKVRELSRDSQRVVEVGA